MRRLAVIIAVLLLAGVARSGEDDPARRAGASYTGQTVCVGCHDQKAPDLVLAWRNSFHAAARPVDGARGLALYRAVTGLQPEGKYRDAGVGCEACHGPGSLHRESGMPRHIMRYRDLSPARAAMACGACHSVGHTADGLDYPAGYLPGDDLAAKFTLDPQATGVAARYNEFLRGPHGRSGKLSCTACHEPHGGQVPHQLKAEGNRLCADCHPTEAERPARHKPGAERKQCTACHMPGGNHAGKP